MFDAHTGSSPDPSQFVGHTHSPASHLAPYLHSTPWHKSIKHHVHFHAQAQIQREYAFNLNITSKTSEIYFAENL